ncbi:MAG: glutamine amidotransferase, partial [Hyphomicrobiales bacterium]|nr:glutamine amidotransferase [Hyphomicrobiales bacterium]
GPMSANDEEDHVRREIDWISVPLKEEAPFFGICLGGQMLARQIGGSVGPHPEGKAEIGYYPLQPTPSGAALIEWPDKVYQWHREGFRLPESAEVLATGEIFEQQAFRYGRNAYGIQFHCELTLAMMHRWTVRGYQRLDMPGAQGRREHFAGRAIHDAPLRDWMERFIDLWLASDAR